MKEFKEGIRTERIRRLETLKAIDSKQQTTSIESYKNNMFQTLETRKPNEILGIIRNEF